MLNKTDIGDKYLVFRSSLINHYHSITCCDMKCFCTKTFYVAEPRQANAITASIFK